MPGTVLINGLILPSPRIPVASFLYLTDEEQEGQRGQVTRVTQLHITSGLELRSLTAQLPLTLSSTTHLHLLSAHLSRVFSSHEAPHDPSSCPSQ